MLWPVRPLADEQNPRIRKTQTNAPPPPGHADTLDPSPARVEQQDALRHEAGQSGISPSEVEARHTDVSEPKPQREMLCDAGIDGGESAGNAASDSGQTTHVNTPKEGEKDEVSEDDLDRWEPKPPKVLMEDSNDVPLEVLSQIQQYATNE